MSVQTPLSPVDVDTPGQSSPLVPRGSSYDDAVTFELLHEDSPPSLTASGSSDDCSSPSVASDRMQRQQQQRQSPLSYSSVTGALRHKVSTEVAFDEAMSPWSNADAIDASQEMECNLPFGAPTEHSFLTTTPPDSSYRLSSHLLSMFASPSSSSSPGIPVPDDADFKNSLRSASQNMAEGNRGGQRQTYDAASFASSSTWGSGQKQPFSTDEQIFDSIIEEDSFGPPSTRASDYAGSPQPSHSEKGQSLSSVFDALRIPGASVSCAVNDVSLTTPVKGEPFETSSSGLTLKQADARRPTSIDKLASPSKDVIKSVADAVKATKGRKSASSPTNFKSSDAQCSSNTYSEGEVTFSAITVIRPEADGLADLQIHVHGVAARGAKSRVETQIKAHLELVRPRNANNGASSPPILEWDRIGSFTHLKLPPLSATKRKIKKNQQSTVEIPKEKTLYLDVAVVNASPPHQRAFVCQSCSDRERKRAERRKNGRAKSGPAPSEEEMRKLGVDPSSANAAEVAAERLTQEESNRIILFNCGDYLEFKDGHAELPTRITCYCRHHKEKLGFCILFTMRNWKGKTVACGSTPAIMITDDHKSSAALDRLRRGAAAAAAGPTSNSAELETANQASDQTSRQNSVLHEQSRANSVEASGPPDPTGSGARSKQRRFRPKPYDAQRRGTTSGNGGSGGVATASLASSVASTSSSLEHKASSADLVQPLAAIGQKRALLQQQRPRIPEPIRRIPALFQPQGRKDGNTSAPMAPTNARSGRESLPHGCQQTQFQLQKQSQVSEQQNQSPLPAQANNILLEGSISPETLVTNPFSIPGFDIANPVVAQQMLAIFGQQGFVPRGSAGNVLRPHQPQPSQPAAVISKVIPGEGPTTGGIEVTVLGCNFTDGLTCFFGDLAASSTRIWASNTLICVLPPSPSPGAVAVTLRTAEELRHQRISGYLPPHTSNDPPQLFTYVDKSDTQLMELALQVVGFQQTRTMQVPREIALRLLASGQGSINSNFAAQQQQQQQQQQLSYPGGQYQARETVAGLFAAAANQRERGANGFQDTIIDFLQLLDVDNGVVPRRLDAIRLANSNGQTLLHLAVVLDFQRLATRLLSLGCPIDARDRSGLTALHLAALNGRLGLARILLERGARKQIRSLNGQTPLDLAEQQDLVDVRNLFTTEPASPQVAHTSLSPSCVEDTIDEDNISSSDLDFSSDEDDVEGPEPQEEESFVDEGAHSKSKDATPMPRSILPTSDISPKSSSAATASGNKPIPKDVCFKEDDAANLAQQTSPTTLQAFANKLPGGFGGLFGRTAGLPDNFFPRALQQKMQEVPVFHAAVPDHPSDAFNWRSNGVECGNEKIGLDRKDKEAEAIVQHGAPSASYDHDPSRLMNFWRTLIEETGGFWASGIQGQQQQGQRVPPPAYEEAATPRSEMKDRETAAGSSTDVASVSTKPRASRRSNLVTRRSSTSSLVSTLSSTTIVAGATTAQPPRRLRMGVEDDWMLRWFWLPCLLVVVLVAAFSTGPLSMAALAAYIPQFGRF